MSIALDAVVDLLFGSGGVSPAELHRAIDRVLPIVPAAPRRSDVPSEPLASEQGSAMAAALALMNVGFFSRKKVKELTGWSDTTLWRNWSEGNFPKPIRVSKNRVGWLPGDIAEWLGNLSRTDGSPAIAREEARTIVPAIGLPASDPGKRGRGRPKNPRPSMALGAGHSP